MEEISRSDAIKVMNTWKFICSLGDNVEPRAIGVTRFEMIDTCTKAISDMQKLEKIEKIVEEMWDENSYYNNTMRFAEKIEQILRGGE